MGNSINKPRTSEEKNTVKGKTENSRRKIALLAILYFVQGIPYGLQVRFLPIYLRTQGSSLTQLGLFKLLLIPWLLKPMWAPLIDRFGSKDKWLMFSMGGLAMTFVALAIISRKNEALLCLCVFCMNMLSSIQDISVDSIAITTLKNSELVAGNTAQVVGYKVGSIVGGGTISWLNELIHWNWISYGLSFLYALLTLSLLLKRSESRDTLLELEQPCNQVPNLQARNNNKNVYLVNGCTKNRTINGYNPFRESEEPCRSRTKYPRIIKNLAKFAYELYSTCVSQIVMCPGTPWMLVYVLIYKLGEQGAIGLFPLFLIDSGISPAKIGFWTGIVGQSMSIVGSLGGGWLIANRKMTSAHMLTTLSLARILSIATQTLIVWVGVRGIFAYELAVLTLCTTQLIGGAITSASFTAMMQCSQQVDSGMQTSHWTILATLEVMGKLVFGAAAGILADFAGYYLVFFVFTILSALVPVWLSLGREHIASFSLTENLKFPKNKN